MSTSDPGKPAQRWKSRLTAGSKFAVAALILFLLFRSGMIDPAKLRSSLGGHPGLFALGLLLMLAGGAVSVQRWVVLLAGQGIVPGYWQAFKLTYIGFTFSLVIPGSVSGDIVKAYYVARGKGQKKKAEAVTTIAIDRLLGLYTMFLMGIVGLVTSLAGMLWTGGEMGIWRKPQIRQLSLFVGTVFGGMTLLFGLFLSRRIGESRWFRAVLERVPFSSFLRRVYQAVNLYGADRRRAVAALLLSIGAQIPLYAGVYCMAAALDVSGISAGSYLVMLPVCFMLNSIPVAPGGFGVGEAAFRWVFGLFGSDQGANVALLFHAAFVLLALLGVGFYLRERIPSAASLERETADEA